MSDVRWVVVENIAIYFLVTVGIIWSRTGLPLWLLLFTNFLKHTRSN